MIAWGGMGGNGSRIFICSRINKSRQKKRKSGEESERRKVGVNQVPPGDQIWKRMKSVHSSKEKVVCVCSVSQTLCNPMDCSPPGSSVHEISWGRILEWVAISYSRESSQPRDQNWVSCIAGRFFTN